MQLTGIHHLTAVTANAPGNHAFYTETLGMRLVKKTVNQDDVSAYHLFYADGVASPGSDITFFDWPVGPERRGTRSICRTGLRVAGEPSLVWWKQRLAAAGVTHGDIVLRDGRATLDLEDPEGQRLSLIDDGGAGPAHAWADSPVPSAHQIRGLGPITISVPDLAPTEAVLTTLMNMTRVRDYETVGNPSSRTQVYAMGQGGAAAELHVAVEPDQPVAAPGAGGVHHVAFRVPDAAYQDWAERLRRMRVPSSGPVDRFYFRSLYFREPNGVLFEIATDGPGFAVDEPLETLGRALSLPPFLESRRREIEAGLAPL
ncbi:ring-cleaving dioxygenase [Rhodoplanes roseus]|uniref:Ring-cleaving dioxygenase n=1 Tax=Rhodoplanes roseus TaxID=29409 RepID=A0A327L4J0_9BRAD|nr:ring-cleaving dioxygenase [Rhodoplanes roseus]RAI45859.1 ring-cleaving dioxygenase [Rhodoplanes roseus]